MSHTSFVQPVYEERGAGSIAGEGLCPSLALIGLLGCEEQYPMPMPVLEALAGHLGGQVTPDLPPFLVACSNGLVLVLTVSVGNDYMGAAFTVPADTLALIDHRLAELWARTKSTRTVSDFFADTAFTRHQPAAVLPASIGQTWRLATC